MALHKPLNKPEQRHTIPEGWEWTTCPKCHLTYTTPIGLSEQLCPSCRCLYPTGFQQEKKSDD